MLLNFLKIFLNNFIYNLHLNSSLFLNALIIDIPLYYSNNVVAKIEFVSASSLLNERLVGLNNYYKRWKNIAEIIIGINNFYSNVIKTMNVPIKLKILLQSKLSSNGNWLSTTF